MSEAASPALCPNCEHPLTGNYCSGCGQPAHLHNDTVAGLVAHFFAHYFHYESRFWQTMKVLWTSPGALTLAYRKKQRARYVPPLSLYMFLVVSSFALTFLIGKAYASLGWEGSEPIAQVEIKDPGKTLATSGLALSMRELGELMENNEAYIEQRAGSLLPKIFFFLVPVMALFLGLLLAGRGYGFVDHLIFSLHVHAFLFSSWTLLALIPERFAFAQGLTYLMWFVSLIYLSAAIKRVYGLGAVRAGVSAFVICVAYTIALLFFLVLLVVYVLRH